jgi:hypothetical protein
MLFRLRERRPTAAAGSGHSRTLGEARCVRGQRRRQVLNGKGRGVSAPSPFRWSSVPLKPFGQAVDLSQRELAADVDQRGVCND